MSDIGELTERRKLIDRKKAEVELARLRIKKDEFEIRKIEIEEELEKAEKKIRELQELINQKVKELK